MTEPPRRLAVIGGGPVGCEFAQYFARIGARVTLVQSEATLLRSEDHDIGESIARALANDGVDVRVGCDVVSVVEPRDRSGAKHRVIVRDRDGEARIDVDAIMLASHRVPNVDSLDLERAGVTCEAGGGIAVEADLRTSNSAIFAAGDVLGRRCLVHVAEYTGRLAARNALDGTRIAADFDRFEAHAVYTQPQVAVAGLTENACRERNIAIEVRRHPFSDVGKALVSDTAEGFMKMIARRDGPILGVAIVGDDAIDLIGEAIALIDRGTTTREVAEMPHLHPTMGEIYARVADDFEATVAR